MNAKEARKEWKVIERGEGYILLRSYIGNNLFKYYHLNLAPPTPNMLK